MKLCLPCRRARRPRASLCCRWSPSSATGAEPWLQTCGNRTNSWSWPRTAWREEDQRRRRFVYVCWLETAANARVLKTAMNSVGGVCQKSKVRHMNITSTPGEQLNYRGREKSQQITQKTELLKQDFCTFNRLKFKTVLRPFWMIYHNRNVENKTAYLI